MTDVEKQIFALVYARCWCQPGDDALAIERAEQAVSDLRESKERGPIVDDPDVRTPRPPHPCLGLLEAVAERRLVTREQVDVLMDRDTEFRSRWSQAKREGLLTVELNDLVLTDAGRLLLEEEGP